MNKAKLKSYAPAARRDFIQAVTDRAHFFGISEKEIVPVEESGDVAIIGGRPFPRAVAAQRRKLDARVKRDGFSQVMEAVAYTWFNRFLALRYMELHGYLEHGFRVLSNTGSSTTPEILDHAAQLDLPGLNKQKVTELKLDGNKDAELYRILLVAQCNALHSTMPFLFEKIEDETELLLPDNLLHSDSLIRKLVNGINEEDWQEVEIIGWLYQFYISEKKDQVIGKVVKSEDIPAATQLFTPNWIVKYMVQNSLGRQWLATYPDSPLKTKMEYYIEPAEQIDEVKNQLADITPVSINPEQLTLLDPASGSGHILVEAYDVFKEIYLERGYSNRDFPRLILEKNLFGLDIDDRAAQMSGFALLMKARKDDRRILRGDNPVQLNVMSIQESGGIRIEHAHWDEQNISSALQSMVKLFHNGKTFGSLLKVPETLAIKLSLIEKTVKQTVESSDLYASQTAKEILPLIKQSMILSGKYDFVVANPPYMGGKGMNQALKDFAKVQFAESKSDLFAMFIERGFELAKAVNGYNAQVTMQSWMFLSSYENLRKRLLDTKTISCLVHMNNGVMGIAFGTAATIFKNKHYPGYIGSFSYVDSNDLNEQNVPKEFPVKNNRCVSTSSDKFNNIPGSPTAYWVSNGLYEAFSSEKNIDKISPPRIGMMTTDNERFLRCWQELDFNNIGFDFESTKSAVNSHYKWFPYNKGGGFRKWAGFQNLVVNWQFGGKEIAESGMNSFRGKDFYFHEGLTWSDLTSGDFTCRYTRKGFVFDIKGTSAFPSKSDIGVVGSILNSNVGSYILNILNPTMSYQSGDIRRIPLPKSVLANSGFFEQVFAQLVEISSADWDSFETSWNFQISPLLDKSIKSITVSDSWDNWKKQCESNINTMQQLETENNRFFIEAYGLQNELTPEVPENQITITNPDREADMKRFISYAIGCMMGRYSLDQSGLVYANCCSIGFDSTKYSTFTADDDGIVPAMDMDWFQDDAASRFEQFLNVVWSPETLEENLKFVANSLIPKGGETARETIRRYISTQFYKDHLQSYKKRPIYWLFSSGKQRAFECLVYLHRYNESTLSRMRNEYVTPLQGKFSAQADYLANEINTTTSTAERNRLQKIFDTLRNKQAELATFDEQLRHFADQRISLDLDDGVKVNYGKFGNLLADVKAVTGGSE